MITGNIKYALKMLIFDSANTETESIVSSIIIMNINVIISEVIATQRSIKYSLTMKKSFI